MPAYVVDNKWDLLIYKGSSVDLNFSVLDEEGHEFNLSNWSVRFRASTVVKTTELNGGIDFISIQHGTGVVHLKPADTSALYEGVPFSVELYKSTDVYQFINGVIRFVNY